jgi:hypothetical protein
MKISKSNSKPSSKAKDDPNIVLKFIKEQKYIKICSVLDEFKPKKLNDNVHRLLIKFSEENDDVWIENYVDVLYSIISFASDNFTKAQVEIIVYYFFEDLRLNECFGELYKLIGTVEANNPNLDFTKKPDITILNLKLMAEYSYSIIKISSDKFLCQSLIQVIVKDFEKCSKGFDKLKKIKIGEGNYKYKEHDVFRKSQIPSRAQSVNSESSPTKTDIQTLYDFSLKHKGICNYFII